MSCSAGSGMGCHSSATPRRRTTRRRRPSRPALIRASPRRTAAPVELEASGLVVADLAQYTSSKPASLRPVELVMRRGRTRVEEQQHADVSLRPARRALRSVTSFFTTSRPALQAAPGRLRPSNDTTADGPHRQATQDDSSTPGSPTLTLAGLALPFLLALLLKRQALELPGVFGMRTSLGGPLRVT